MRILSALAVLSFTSLASAQIIYEPPVRVEHPKYPPAKAMAIARSIHWVDTVVIVQGEDGRVLRVISGPEGEMDRPLVDEGIDPETRQPLFFRKRDLLMELEAGLVRPDAVPAPTTRPSGEKGSILIKPGRPNRAGSMASR